MRTKRECEFDAGADIGQSLTEAAARRVAALPRGCAAARSGKIQAMASRVEIERKFLLDGVPPTMRLARREPIRQGYLALDGDTEVRVRITPTSAVLTIKSGRGGVRIEEELALDARQRDALWELTEGRRVQKTRRRVRVGDAVVEVDEYSGALDGLVVAEVEFDDEEASNSFRPPSWFARELTGDSRYSNRSLASDGLPADAGD
jgi:CYTH domain-containing protein